jgi:hypothetical protein
MDSLPPLNEGDLHLVVRYSLDSEESMSVAIVDAFLAAGVDVYEKPTQLVDWVNADVLDNLQWSSDRLIYFCTRIWDHLVVLTPEEVRIYSERMIR